MRIAISGVQCTGKSTVLKELKRIPELSGYEFVFEGIRNLRDKIKINEDGNDDTQIVIANFHKTNLQKENVVLDRCMLDCYAYTLYSYQNGMISKETFDKVTAIYRETISQYDVILYLRPEFEMVEDGVRSLNKEFRDKVLENFESLIKDLKNVVILTGSVENRVNQFKALIKYFRRERMKILSNIRSSLPETDKPVVCVLSGGLDSTVLTYLLNTKYKDIRLLAFNYGQRHSIELEKAKTTASKLGLSLKVIDISFIGDIVKDVCSLSGKTTVGLPTNEESKDDVQANFVVPYRNLVFQSVALSYAESLRAEYVFLGIQNGDNNGFWDCRPNYYEKLNELTSLNDLYKIKVLTPFLNLTKVDEIRIGEALGVPFEDTWTCYKGSEDGNNKPCGICHSCAERLEAFKTLGIKDPLGE